ncbi:MAG TPA: phosphate ABC transporter permease PstA [Terrimicrobiaceae bacterium]|jgi:phosphate transport system permease protein|nr:phosphate ABC transporter permease PstA [Terrimicrobiaceae bacterium]
MADIATAAQPTDFFASAKSARVGVRSLWSKLLSGICVGLALLTLVPLFSIVFLVLKNGLPLLSWRVFTELPPAAGMTGGGFGNAVVGTVLMVGIALVLATPFGVLSAIYINEYEPFSALSNAVRFVAKLLTGIPSIICGVFAYAVIVLTTGGFSAWAGGFALAILILPTILLTAEQALLGVSKAYREASYGLGATNFQTIWRVVLPDAMPAIMTGIMLAVARAAGETAPLIFTALFSQFWIQSLSEPTASLSVLIFNFSTLPFEHQVKMAWTASLVLVILVTIANITAQVVFRRR